MRNNALDMIELASLLTEQNEVSVSAFHYWLKGNDFKEISFLLEDDFYGLEVPTPDQLEALSISQDWKGQKERLSRLVKQQIDDYVAERLEGQIERMNRQHIELTEAASMHLSLMLRNVFRDADGQVSETNLTPRELKDITTAIKSIVSVQRVIFGLPDKVVEGRHVVDFAKLADEL